MRRFVLPAGLCAALAAPSTAQVHDDTAPGAVPDFAFSYEADPQGGQLVRDPGCLPSYSNVSRPTAAWRHMVVGDIVSDDLLPVTGAKGNVCEVTFTIMNATYQGQIDTVDLDLFFYRDSGDYSQPSPGPMVGHVHVIADFASTITEGIGQGSYALVTIGELLPYGVDIPDAGYMWTGLRFNSATGDGSTQPVPSDLGQVLFDPPDLGTSEDRFFRSSQAPNNPRWFGGNPVANFGWAVQATPAPGGLALVGLLGAMGARRRRA